MRDSYEMRKLQVSFVYLMVAHQKLLTTNFGTRGRMKKAWTQTSFQEIHIKPLGIPMLLLINY